MNESYDDLDELPAPPRKSIPDADRVLLELAARALGAAFKEVDGEGYGNLHFPDGSIVYSWNPLQFSGDTFDLQVDLQMQVSVDNGTATVGFSEGFAEETNWGESRAAARRAVVRVAAEIGKTKS